MGDEISRRCIGLQGLHLQSQTDWHACISSTFGPALELSRSPRPFRARLCIEGIPTHARTEVTAVKLIGPRLEPSAVRGPNEDPDGDGGRPHPRYQSRSRSLWGRITGRSHSSERGGDGQGFYNEDTRGCQRNRDTYITINHIRRSRDDTEVRAPISLSAAQKQKPKRGGGSLAIDLSSSPAELFSFHHGDQGNQEQQEDPIRALTVRRRKMPFLRVEAAISFSPEGEHGVQGSPVYVPLSGGTVVTQAEDVNNNSAADLIASLTTPIVSWNVRGLNAPAKREAVRNLLQQQNATLVCLQETKLQDVDKACIIETNGVNFQNNFFFLPAEGSRGGIILAADENYFTLSHCDLRMFSLTAKVTMRETNAYWTITGAYGP
uniref:Retrotransposon protein, putative, LINE subclass n=1 Tax=Oryza sativa subsp. japonica TaxID=39947 RepID=Q2QME0_ORYSJ|nr:retrotransposon protein, putative, LINE subclass [Oryza sativa Japonica Group]